MRIAILLLVMLAAPSMSANSDAVIEDLSRRSHIPVADLRELLSNCQGPQLAMTICAFRDFVAADLDMKPVLEVRLSELPQCADRLKSRQKKWERRRDRECDVEADKEAEGGSMRPMVYNSCLAQATRARTRELMAMNSCEKAQ